MYNKLYICLKIYIRYNTFFPSLVGFWTGHSTDHAVIELVDKIANGLMGNKYIISVFHLSKTLDTIDTWKLKF